MTLGAIVKAIRREFDQQMARHVDIGLNHNSEGPEPIWVKLNEDVLPLTAKKLARERYFRPAGEHLACAVSQMGNFDPSMVKLLVTRQVGHHVQVFAVPPGARMAPLFQPFVEG